MKIALPVLVLTISPVLSHAATTMVGTSSITYAGTALSTDFATNPTNLINSAGLSGAPTIGNYTTITHADASSGNSWTTNDRGIADFFSGSPPTVILEVVFDATYTLSDFVHWGYDFGTVNNNNIKTLNLEYGVGNFTGGTLTGLTVARTNTTSNAVTTSLGTNFNADRVRITITDNYFGEAGGLGGDRVSLGEIRFLAVPEPSVAILSGLSIFSLLRRRRG